MHLNLHTSLSSLSFYPHHQGYNMSLVLFWVCLSRRVSAPRLCIPLYFCEHMSIFYDPTHSRQVFPQYRWYFHLLVTMWRISRVRKDHFENTSLTVPSRVRCITNAISQTISLPVWFFFEARNPSSYKSWKNLPCHFFPFTLSILQVPLCFF